MGHYDEYREKSAEKERATLNFQKWATFLCLHGNPECVEVRKALELAFKAGKLEKRAPRKLIARLSRTW